jgi:hypothetical protein
VFIVSLQSSCVKYSDRVRHAEGHCRNNELILVRFEFQSLNDAVLYLMRESISADMFYINNLYFLNQT